MSEVEAVERLRRLVARLGELGPDGEWLAGVLEVYLNPFGNVSLDEAAALAPMAGGAHWRTTARRALRDDAIRQLAQIFPGGNRKRAAAKIWGMLIGYATTRWKIDRERPTMPEHYAGTPRAHLYAVLVAEAGDFPGESRLRQILSIRSPVSVVTEVGQTGGHDTSTDHRRDERR
jgi:hypothetical protein